MPRLVVLCLWLVLLGACATLKNDRGVCPEYRDIRCMTEIDCSLDEARRCRVCKCLPPGEIPPARLPETSPP